MEPIAIDDFTPVSPIKATFTLVNCHVAYANTLRRLIMTGVETVAFRADMVNGTTTDVKVEANDTPMTNEMLAHRIGLLPIHIENPFDADLESLTFALDVKAEKDRYKDVTCADFVITKELEGGKEPVTLRYDEFFPENPITRDTCLIATLAPGNGRLKLSAKASIGTGRENARFQPTSQCSYSYTRDTDEATVDEHFTEWLEKAKKQSVAELEGGDEKAKGKLAAYRREYETMEIAKVYLKDEKGEPYSYDFAIETVGPLKISYIMRRACDVGEAMMAKYTGIDTGVLPEDGKLRVIPSQSRVLGYDFIMKEQDHTFGNMIQTYLEQNHIFEGDETPDGPVKITYAGYEVPHPLRDEMVLRIGVAEQDEALKAFAQACAGCVEIFRRIRTAWTTAVPEAAMNMAKGALRSAVKVNKGVSRAKVIIEEGLGAARKAEAAKVGDVLVAAAAKFAPAPAPASEPKSKKSAKKEEKAEKAEKPDAPRVLKRKTATAVEAVTAPAPAAAAAAAAAPPKKEEPPAAEEEPKKPAIRSLRRKPVIPPS